MAADTALKRLSAMDPRCPWRRALPLPNGTLDAADRAMVLGLYARAGAAPEVLTPRLILVAPPRHYLVTARPRVYTLVAEHKATRPS